MHRDDRKLVGRSRGKFTPDIHGGLRSHTANKSAHECRSFDIEVVEDAGGWHLNAFVDEKPEKVYRGT